MNLLIDDTFESHNCRRIELFPSADISEVTKQIVEMRRKVVIDFQASFNEFLAPPLKMLEAFGNSVDINAKQRNCCRC